jgi:hypothetical protein
MNTSRIFMIAAIAAVTLAFTVGSMVPVLQEAFAQVGGDNTQSNENTQGDAGANNVNQQGNAGRDNTQTIGNVGTPP